MEFQRKIPYILSSDFALVLVLANSLLKHRAWLFRQAFLALDSLRINLRINNKSSYLLAEY